MLCLDQGERLVTVEGPPLSGKSHVLLELIQLAQDNPDLAVLYIDADQGADLSQTIASCLSEALDWPLTREEARNWLTRLSRRQGPALVVGIDNLGVDRDGLRADLEALTSNAFGVGVRVVLALDDALAGQLMMRRNGRELSPLGRRAQRFELSALDNDEYRLAQEHLGSHQIEIMHGGGHSPDLRTPWILRTMVAEAAADRNFERPELTAVLPPMAGLDLIVRVRERFDVTVGPLSLYRELAKAILADVAAKPSTDFMVALQGNFVVLRESALAALSAGDLGRLSKAGLIREGRTEAHENIYVIRLPHLMVSEMAALLADELASRAARDADKAAAWLCDIASHLPLGDLIAAQGIIDAALRGSGLAMALISALLQRPPQREVLSPGTKFATWLEGVGALNITLRADGSLELERHGKVTITEPDEHEAGEHVVYTDFQPWMILSWLAAVPFEARGKDGQRYGRGDLSVAIEVGSSPIVLRPPGGDPDVTSVATHHLGPDLEVVCHHAGIAEPITWSIFRFLAREEEAAANYLIDEAIGTDSAALHGRVDIALRELAKSADHGRADWARATRKNRIESLLDAGLTHHMAGLHEAADGEGSGAEESSRDV
jgi:hypothetical protein